MQKLLFFSLCVLCLSACQTDEMRQKEFVGSYEVRLDAPQAEEEMSKAKEEMSEELDKAKEEIRTSIEQAKEDIEAELGDKSDLNDAAENFVEGMGKFAEGMTELGEGLGKMGLNIGEGLLKGLKIKATFKENGTVSFGKGGNWNLQNDGINFSIGDNDKLRWKIVGSEMELWKDGEEADKQVFQMKKISDTEWDLTGDEVTFHLKKV